MFASRSVITALLACASLTACADLDDGESLAETTSNLSSTSWTSPTEVDSQLSYPPAMAMLGGIEFYVYGWDGNNPVPGSLSHDLYWHRCDTTGACTSRYRIPGQESMSRVNLAAFNGYIYMV